MTQYDHCRLIDLRPVKPVGDMEAALKAKPCDQAQDDLRACVRCVACVALRCVACVRA